MAGDWMKIELELPDKPEVHAIAGMTNLDPDAVVGKLIRIWQWFDKHTVDGNALGVSFVLVDRISGVTGFGEAMAFVDWLEQHDKYLVMPKFDRHTSESAKKRALTAKRVAKHNSKTNAITNSNSVSNSLVNALPREEKRREDIKHSSATNVSVVDAQNDESEKSVEYSASFLTFWDMYPCKKNKGSAFKAFKKIKPTEYPEIKSGLLTAKQSLQWKKNNGEFIPHPATWLNARGWEDEQNQSAVFDMQQFLREKGAIA